MGTSRNYFSNATFLVSVTHSRQYNTYSPCRDWPLLDFDCVGEHSSRSCRDVDNSSDKCAGSVVEAATGSLSGGPEEAKKNAAFLFCNYMG